MKLSANTVHQKEKHCDDVYVTEYRNLLDMFIYELFQQNTSHGKLKTTAFSLCSVTKRSTYSPQAIGDQ